MDKKNSYTTIAHDVRIKTTFKKSRFYASVKEVEKDKQVKEFLKELKQEFPDANHHCWAYHVGIDGNQIKQHSDAGEPANSAGVPISQAIEQEKITNVMVIVTRYFGGIKLGIGGLIRAYRETALKGLRQAGRLEKYALREFFLRGINYGELGGILQAIKSRGGLINHIDYDQKISIVSSLSDDEQEWLNNMIKNISRGRATIKIGQIKWYKKK